MAKSILFLLQKFAKFIFQSSLRFFLHPLVVSVEAVRKQKNPTNLSINHNHLSPSLLNKKGTLTQLRVPDC